MLCTSVAFATHGAEHFLTRYLVGNPQGVCEVHQTEMLLSADYPERSAVQGHMIVCTGARPPGHTWVSEQYPHSIWEISDPCSLLFRMGCLCLFTGRINELQELGKYSKCDASFTIIQNQECQSYSIDLNISFIYTAVENLRSTFPPTLSFEPHNFIIREERKALCSDFSIKEKNP